MQSKKRNGSYALKQNIYETGVYSLIFKKSIDFETSSSIILYYI